MLSLYTYTKISMVMNLPFLLFQSDLELEWEMKKRKRAIRDPRSEAQKWRSSDFFMAA